MILRFSQLIVGLVLFGVGCAVMVDAGIGLDPWTVFAEGVSKNTGIGIGWVVSITGFLVLLLWIPLRQRPGVGTVANILVVGAAMQFSLPLLGTPDHWLARVVMFLAGTVLVGVASGIYIGARLGPGPRDGLMTGIHQRWGWPIWAGRLGVEATVLVTGWLLGGTVGLGTVLFAVLIGPIVHVSLPLFDRRSRSRVGGGTGRAEPAAAPAAPMPGLSAPGT
ncbi:MULTISPECIES: YczE/YyaS/YitT family protein [Microbacterium]|uniref:membrane protein YczE n=1 Tax=Microbacterium TaxID=33882 RepID=UPI000E73391E|nr:MULTISPECIES: hypothetical protein [Microbacterium]MDF2578579.1 hypothetical protein [Microbacterium sp.]RKE63163.1 putative membrane protein YczE [Microbacterium sp. AG238]WJM17205.1 hypothetical protein QUC20_07885 [Microbacterium arborescens]